MTIKNTIQYQKSDGDVIILQKIITNPITLKSLAGMVYHLDTDKFDYDDRYIVPPIPFLKYVSDEDNDLQVLVDFQE